MFYTFSQNNSGGRFNHDETAGIGYAVIVEADSAEDANSRAEAIGLYFNGAGDDGPDCPCCGDRWYEAGRWSGDCGTDGPTMYSCPVAAYFTDKDRTTWDLPVYVHYKDGKITKYGP